MAEPTPKGLSPEQLGIDSTITPKQLTALQRLGAALVAGLSKEQINQELAGSLNQLGTFTGKDLPAAMVIDLDTGKVTSVAAKEDEETA